MVNWSMVIAVILFTCFTGVKTEVTSKYKKKTLTMVDHLPAGHQEASPMVSKAASPRSSSGSCSRERGRSGSTKSSSSSAGAPSTVEAGISGGTCTGITSGVGAVSTKGVSDGDSGEEYEGVMFS